MMEDNIRKYEYALTGDPDETDSSDHYSPEVVEILTKCHQMVQRVNPKVLPRLIKLIKKYPRVPALLNYLSAYYAKIGNDAKAFAVNEQILRKFPDYLMAKINLANEYIIKQEYERIPFILGPALDLQGLYPHRRIFHYNEYIPYMEVVMRYLFLTDQIPAVASRVPMIRKLLGKDHELVEWIGYQLQAHMAFSPTKEAYETVYEERGYDTSRATTAVPVYHHPEVEALCEQTLDECYEDFPKLLQLPRQTLIADLQTMLNDTIHRYAYWMKQMESYDVEFHLPAILLLREVDEDSCFDFLLDSLRQGKEFLEDWYDDWLTEEYWRFLYPAAQRRIPELVAFLQEPNLYAHAKLAVAAVFNQIAAHYEDRYQEIKNAYQEVMTYYLEHQEDKVNLCDPEFCNLLSLYVVIFKEEIIIELMRRFYEEELCYPEFEGGFKERMNEINDPQTYIGEKWSLPKSSAVEDAKRLVDFWYR